MKASTRIEAAEAALCALFFEDGLTLRSLLFICDDDNPQLELQWSRIGKYYGDIKLDVK